MRDIIEELSGQNLTFVVSGLSADVKRKFVGVASQNENRDGLTDFIGAERFFNHLEEALAIFHPI